MLIANPIYDVVFKYLLDNNKIAKLFISTIIDTEIITLKYQPHEIRKQIEKNSQFTVYHIDFAATIKTADGESKQVIIEIQKAKLPTDIMRFRKYLGAQYMNSNNVVSEPQVKYKRKVKALPIISIYFLGYPLEKTKAPVISVKRKYTDVSLNKELKIKEEFIESLTHDSFVVQIPYLKENRRNDLEIMLSVFDQSNRKSNHHIMNIKEDDFPKKYQHIIRHLQKANENEEVREGMEAEDLYLSTMTDYERELSDKKKELIDSKKELSDKKKELSDKKKELSDKKKELSDRKKELSDKKKELSDRKKELTDRKKELKNKDNIINEKDNIIEQMKEEMEKLRIKTK